LFFAFVPFFSPPPHPLPLVGEGHLFVPPSSGSGLWGGLEDGRMYTKNGHKVTFS